MLAGLGLVAGARAQLPRDEASLLGRWTSAVVESARRFGAGDLTARAPVPRGLGELTDVANALNAAAEEIEHRQQEQARLIAELVAAEEETRRRIAADIHDDTAQAVAAAGLRMDAAGRRSSTDPAEREAVLKARTALGEANRRLRRLLFELRPPALDEAGLAPGSRAVPDRLLRTTTGSIGGWTTGSRTSRRPSRARSSTASRSRRSRTCASTPTPARSRCCSSAAASEWCVRVRDDGSGFEVPEPDAAAEPGHIGLVSMRERAEAAGGRFALTSTPGEAGRPWTSGCRSRTGAASPECRAASPPPPRPRGRRRRASRRRAGGGSSRSWRRGGACARCRARTCRRPSSAGSRPRAG